ncbi:putative ubiquitin-conjugating enzyme E2 24 [Forsythia ovata]|uniref:Ubiquitin-conjugating enzyme E2 24 n=1 Tax=Forsythia ovata TaxID=205694 RepID=A0ABD1S2P9_9LAMI
MVDRHVLFSLVLRKRETIGKIDDFLLSERVFMHEDIVCLESDPLGQMGKKIRSISVGDYVVSGEWLGKVEKIVDCITVLFDDCKKCELSTIGPEKVIAISPDVLEDLQYPFYPGQKVQVEPSSVSKSVGWLCGTRKNKKNQGTVCNVDAGLACVDWLDCAAIDFEKRSAPQCLQDSKI